MDNEVRDKRFTTLKEKTPYRLLAARFGWITKRGSIHLHYEKAFLPSTCNEIRLIGPIPKEKNKEKIRLYDLEIPPQHYYYRKTSISGTTFSGEKCLSGTIFHAI
jgi:hypothetical protein